MRLLPPALRDQHGTVKEGCQRGPLRLPLPAAAAALHAQGAELGRFNMGSTVILLLPPGDAHWQDLHAGQALRVGQLLGRLRLPGTLAP